MKFLVVIMLSVVSLFGGSVGCNKDHSATVVNANTYNEDIYSSNTKGTKMKIKIGSKVFNATLFDNPTAAAFKAMLPLTLKMDELNGNEKKYDFSESFPTNSSNPENDQQRRSDDLGTTVLWCCSIKHFRRQYSYTKLGRIDDPSGLEAAVGTGDVTVTFELE